jgi:Fe-S-cluster containining protein
LDYDEKSLFPKELVYPMRGFAESNESEDFVVVEWQLGVNECPHLENNQCKIYNERPLACKTYPLVDIANYDLDCQGILRMQGLDPLGFSSGVLFTRIENKALESVYERISQYFKKNSPRTLWNFNLEKKKWVRCPVSTASR